MHVRGGVGIVVMDFAMAGVLGFEEGRELVSLVVYLDLRGEGFVLTPAIIDLDSVHCCS